MANAQEIPGALPVPTTVNPQSPIAAPAPPAAPAPTPDKKSDKKTDAKSGDAPAQKIVNNPFAPGGVMTADQLMTRKEVTDLMAEQEARLRKELSGQAMSADEMAKLVSNAAKPVSMNKPDNFMGCVNGVPMYRLNDGTLELGTTDPEPIRKERCGDK